MSGATITIGRSSKATIVADDPTVSRIHAEASLLKSGMAEVRDRDSKNGLYALQDGKRERVAKTVVGKDDVVILGAYELSGGQILERLSATTVIERRPARLEPQAFQVSQDTPTPPARARKSRSKGRKVTRDPETNELRYED